jgi:hypothetical protein
MKINENLNIIKNLNNLCNAHVQYILYLMGCVGQVVVSGKLWTQHAKFMKFQNHNMNVLSGCEWIH